MGILDGIVEWIAEQVMAGLDPVSYTHLDVYKRQMPWGTVLRSAPGSTRSVTSGPAAF